MSISVDNYKTSFDPGNACWMARLSNAVYTSDPKDANMPDGSAILSELQNRDEKFKEVFGFCEGRASAALIAHDDYLCIAFRGTDEKWDWRDNIDFFDKVGKYGCEFHEGFYRQYSQVWKDLEEAYKGEKSKKSRPLFFTGHSLGGAMATVATAIWVLNGDRQFISTYTFGQPRAVTTETARTLAPMCGSRFFRFHNNNDMVPRFPTRSMGYSHVGQIYYIDKNKKIHQDPGFWFRFQDQVRGAVEAIEDLKEKGLDPFADHDVKNYQEAVEGQNYHK